MNLAYKEIVKRTEYILHGIHSGKQKNLNRFCEKDVLCRFNHNFCLVTDLKALSEDLNGGAVSSDSLALKHISFSVKQMPHRMFLISGAYSISSPSESGGGKSFFEYTIMWINGLACYIHISENPDTSKMYTITSVKEEIYNMRENEIFYIEAFGNHVVWNCRGAKIETIDSLKNIVGRLSENFVRVHRSYVVNKKLVKSIQRCSVTMANGDVIPLPYKKYVSVKKELMTADEA